MKIRYQTGIATLIQFTTMTGLGLISGVNSAIVGCNKEGGSCGDSILTSIVFFVLTGMFFGTVWIIGTGAQEKRSKLLARLLIMGELGIILVALFNVQNHGNNLLNLFTSILDICLAVWVIVLAFRLSRAKGGRIVASNGVRARRSSNRPDQL